jgi:hypothetical protein
MAKDCVGTQDSRGGGVNDGLMVLDILAHHPSTAVHRDKIDASLCFRQSIARIS